MPQSQSALFEEPEAWEVAAAEDTAVAEVVVDRPLDRTFEYLVPEGLLELVRPGVRVRAPFGRGNSTLTGFCVGLRDRPSTRHRLKELDAVLDREPLVTEAMLGLTRWIADRYLASWGQVLQSVVPAGVKKQAGTREITFYELAAGAADRLANEKVPVKQRAVLEALLAADGPLRVGELAERAGCGTGPITTLRKKGWIDPVVRRVSTSEVEELSEPFIKEDDLELSAQQAKALKRVVDTLQAGEHQTLLIHGVTGSGKTEVYLQALKEVISYGRQGILLVPEIALTPQTIRRLRARFRSVAVLHSHLTDSERHRQWQKIAAGEVDVVVGARSAVFAPLPNLGVIIIDEEHETTFKQSTTPRYHAREVARERARREKVPLVLGSATPTLESIHRVRDLGEVYVSMPDRVSGRSLPPVSIVDVRTDPYVGKGHSIGRALANSIRQALKDGGQAILFLNLRGYSPVLWCPSCAAGVECPDCSVTLTYHKDKELCLCHTCEYETAIPNTCPKCGEGVPRLLGSGTQRLEAEVRTKFPEARVARMDSDSMRKPGSHDETLGRFGAGEVDVLLGTQMIAKGLDFPNVTLVGVVDADTMLHQPDLRSAERTFHLISQVAGRTGRGDQGGRVFVQTMCPDEPVIRLAAEHNFKKFAQLELAQRRQLQAPPFASLARIILRGVVEDDVANESRRVATLLRVAAKASSLEVRVLGPAPAPLLRLRGQYRYHLQLAADSPETLLTLWRTAEKEAQPTGEIELTVDVDPVDMR